MNLFSFPTVKQGFGSGARSGLTGAESAWAAARTRAAPGKAVASAAPKYDPEVCSPSLRTPDADGVPFAALFQAGCGRAMAQLELLWAAAALMLLGATVSLCLKCQVSGKVLPVGFGVLPAAPGWAGGGRGGQTLSS